MGNIKNEVFLGTREMQNKKFELLAKMAQPEIWTYKKIRETDPYRILRNYFFFTYNRLSEENKIITSEDKEYRCMNTGLLTIYDQEIIALFKKSSKKDGLPWYLVGFFKETDKQFTMHFSQIPQLASYFDNVKDLIYDSSLELTLKKEHIIDDNIERFYLHSTNMIYQYNHNLHTSPLVDSATLPDDAKLTHDTQRLEHSYNPPYTCDALLWPIHKGIPPH